ncbi:alpha/beta hydrolase [Curtobacterium flaccumfaciens]|uniref:alpha/beta hydrolase n=1 Tax=Curtobacterium flaccumfaciens TaxID=2035 RepID=UPI001BDEAF4A|nr:alpha/beta hydrolase [Curtobacterium flaccumfaciens]MBT1596767.1 alpha/beta hydrolase [Curtobacterium flaccumfaciens pv. flaccumfaciens]
MLTPRGPIETSSVRKSLRIILITLGALVAVPVLALATTTVVNVVATHVEASEIDDYGERVPVDGKQMNVVVRGAGTTSDTGTIVLLPGLGTAAPGLDFGPLIDQLARSHRVVAVEPFGTGLSDQTDVPRTAANITREVHEALQHLHVDRYVLMGHSVAGIYALPYTERYRDEVTAFVGIDSSVPRQSSWDEPIPTGTIVALDRLGLLRALGGASSDTYGDAYDDGTKRQMQLLSAKNGAAPTIIDEMRHAPENFRSVEDSRFPTDLPVLLFVRTNDDDVPNWVRLHERQAASVEHGRVIGLVGDHYLHHTLSERIARDTDATLATLGA